MGSLALRNWIFGILAIALVSLGSCDPVSFSPQDHSLVRSTIIDDCCCDVDHLKSSNKHDLNPLLTQLVSKRFFKYFKLDLHSDCPFWVSQAVCTQGGCHICECADEEIPLYWRLEKTDHVDVHTPIDFITWKDIEDDMWAIQGNEEHMSYVNLEQYPEGNTGYRDGSVVWARIYNENCFTRPVDSMCLEERVFYRLISGLHTSINTHVAHNFEWDDKQHKWIPNIQMFERGILPYPDRINNLYFAFLFMLRAVHKAQPFLKEYHYHTGDESDEHEVQELMNRLLSVDLLCSPNFDESILFSDPEKEDLRQQLKSHFRNISLIMNCVSCEKCKVYAKLQTLGMGTALKILLEPDLEKELANLQRNEIIALVNTLRQMSNSIEYLEELVELSQNPGTSTFSQTLDSFR